VVSIPLLHSNVFPDGGKAPLDPGRAMEAAPRPLPARARDRSGSVPLRRDSQHANWDMMPDGRMIWVEPLGGGRLLMVTD
jgi:hypothetical protein